MSDPLPNLSPIQRTDLEEGANNKDSRKTNLQNKKLYLTFGLAILLIGVVAFVGGRLLNGDIGTVGLSGPNGGQVFISMNEITPAPELPATRADVTGSFVERKDNTIVVQAISFAVGVGGVSSEAPIDENSGIQVEVIVTSTTKIYKDVTEFSPPVNGEIHNVQQAAEEGTLDDLNTQCFLSVWGRRSGDRIIAEVLFYMNPQLMKKSGS